MTFRSDDRKLSSKVQEGQSQKTGAAEVKPYGGQDKLGNLQTLDYQNLFRISKLKSCGQKIPVTARQ